MGIQITKVESRHADFRAFGAAQVRFTKVLRPLKRP